MNRNPVESSQIASIGYDEPSSMLEIEFKSFNPSKPGSVYQYSNVPRSVYDGLVGAESIGKFFGANIKSQPDLYPFKKVTEKDAA